MCDGGGGGSRAAINYAKLHTGPSALSAPASACAREFRAANRSSTNTLKEH